MRKRQCDSPGSCLADPSDPEDGGDPANCVTLSLTVGDPSSSLSERWELHFTNDQTGITRRHCDLGYGAPDTSEYAFVKGKSYTFRLKWTGTNRSEQDGPDYDWQCLVNLSDTPGLRQGLYGTGPFIVEDPHGLLTDLHNGSDVNEADGKTFKIYVPKAEIEIADYDSVQWEALPEGKVILSDKETRIKVTMPSNIASSTAGYFDFIGNSLTVKTFETMPSGVQIPISTANTTYSLNGDTFEIRKTLSRTELKTLGLLPSQDDDGVFEKAWMDTGSDNPTADSNLSDGLAFDSLSAVLRGRSTNYGTLEDDPPNSPLHVSFFQAAGVEIITVECKGSKSKPRQLMNQADVFYYSGHGSHASGALTYGNPTLVQPYWSQDLKVAIFAGCSVLDINDYNNNFGDNVSPGTLWEPLGPSVLLGYNYYAPTDLQNSAQIVSSWIANRGSQGNVNAWMAANDNPSGRNACAIEKDSQYTYYHKYMRGVYRKKIIKKENW